MFCNNCGNQTNSEDSFCGNCGRGQSANKNGDESRVIESDREAKLKKMVDHPIQIKKKKKSGVISGWTIVALLIILGAFSSFLDNRGGELTSVETTNIVNDVISDTNTASLDNQQYVDFIKTLLDYSKEENSKMFLACNSLADTDILEFSSYEYIVSLRENIGNVEGCLEEYSDYDSKYDILANKVIGKAKVLASEIDIPVTERAELVKVFNERTINSVKKNLAIKTIELQVQHLKNILVVYNFLITNFDDYEISPDEYGEDMLYFYTDKNIEIYNLLAEETSISSINFEKAEQEFKKYLSKDLQQQGVNVDINDIYNYMYE